MEGSSVHVQERGEGVIQDQLEKWFGMNWRTTLSGYVGLLAAFIAYAPELFPQETPWGQWAQKIAAFIAFMGFGNFARTAKDKAVTGISPEDREKAIQRFAEKQEKLSEALKEAGTPES